MKTEPTCNKNSTLFTGLSDFHKLVLPVFKTTFCKSKPKEIIYRNFKNFEEESFNQELKNNLINSSTESYEFFEKVFLDTLNKHAPLKKKSVRANHAPYVTKTLRKAIMRRSNLQTIYFKKRTPESLKKYKKQKNYCSKLYKKERKAFFSNLNPSNICDNKTFWKYVQPFFSEKRKISNKITLVDDNDTIVSDDQSISEELNISFKNATKSLNIRQNSYLTDESNEIEDQVKKAIFKYKNHPSIILIKNKITVPELFAFTEASVSDIEKELSNLNAKKASTFKNITPKVLKASIESCSEVLTKLFNNTILTSNFPDKLKVADVSPILKKITHKNQRITDLSLFLVSKVFERLLHKQMSLHVEEHLSPYLCGYRKEFRTQQALLSLLERWKNVLDKKGYGGAVLMDLSKAFDTLNHDHLIAKLHAYGFSEESL